MTIKTSALMIAAFAGCLTSCKPKADPGTGGNPVPVTVLDPSTQPNLNLNGFLLSNGAVLGCDEFQKMMTLPMGALSLPVAKVTGSGSVDKITSHDEPPISGGDGSFLLAMQAQKSLAGTNGKTVRVCGITHKDDEGSWYLKWKVWNPGGSENDSGTQTLDLPKLTQMSIEVSFLNSPEKVTISRTTSSLGSAWQASSSPANFKASSVSNFGSAGSIVNELDVANSSTLKMKELNITGVSKTSTPFSNITIKLDRGQIPGKTCSGFVICHDDGSKCPDIAQPKACVP